MYDGKFRFLDDLPMFMVVFGILAVIGLWKIGELAFGLVWYITSHLQWVG
jgi:hypothetical protein